MKPKPKQDAKELEFRAVYHEIPDLMYGMVDNKGVVDVTSFLESRNNSSKNLSGFKKSNAEIIGLYAERLGCSVDELFIKKAGKVYMHDHLGLALVCYVEPSLSCYLHDRLHELLMNGFSVSDRFISMAAKTRLSPEYLQKLAGA
ncbi:MAG: hypothetical protein ACRDD8_05890 [Bacteroidales bacterium]